MLKVEEELKVEGIVWKVEKGEKSCCRVQKVGLHASEI